MKRGHLVLISGSVLLVSGIIISAVWGVSFAGSFLREVTRVGSTTIDPGKSLQTTTTVDQLNRPISLGIGVDKGGQESSSLPYAISLKETVTDPNGKIISTNEFGDGLFTSFTPQVVGVYIVTISNLGTNPITVSETIGYLPFMGPDGNPNIMSSHGNPNMNFGVGMGGLGMIILGGGFSAAGVIVLIVGAVITALDNRGKPNMQSSTTTEGGITYRKD